MTPCILNAMSFRDDSYSCDQMPLARSLLPPPSRYLFVARSVPYAESVRSTAASYCTPSLAPLPHSNIRLIRLEGDQLLDLMTSWISSPFFFLRRNGPIPDLRR